MSFTRLRRAAVLAALLAAAVLFAPGAGGQPPTTPKTQTGKGQVKVGVHRFDMKTGFMYKVKVDANGFTPSVLIRPGTFLRTGSDFRGGDVQGDSFEGYVLPKESRDYRVVVSPNLDDDELDGQLFDYSATVTAIPMAKEPMLDKKDKTVAGDPVYQNPNGGGNRGPHKAYDVNFKAGQIYIITLDMAQQGQFDPYLIVEGPGGKVVAENDDGGESLNSLIVYQPKRGGEHRLIATGLGNRVGEYRLKVVTTVAGAGGAAPKGGKADPIDEK
ncbi:MAG: hypothetical protein U0804_09695 [Gemmataceae bacterium]